MREREWERDEGGERGRERERERERGRERANRRCITLLSRLILADRTAYNNPGRKFRGLRYASDEGPITFRRVPRPTDHACLVAGSINSSFARPLSLSLSLAFSLLYLHPCQCIIYLYDDSLFLSDVVQFFVGLLNIVNCAIYLYGSFTRHDNSLKIYCSYWYVICGSAIETL